MSVVQSPVYLFLVSVPVSRVVVARLSPLTLGVATLVRPAFYMDIHHVAVEAGLCHEAFTTVWTEKPLAGVVLMCCGLVELEVLDSLSTELAGLGIVNFEVVAFFVHFKAEDFLTLQTGQFAGGHCCRREDTWDVTSPLVLDQLLSVRSEVITNAAGQRLAVNYFNMCLQRLLGPAGNFTLGTGEMTFVDSSDVALLGIEAREFYVTAALHVLDVVSAEMVGEELVSFVGENLCTVFTLNAGYHSFSRTFRPSRHPLPLENSVASFIKVFVGLAFFYLLDIVSVSYISLSHTITININLIIKYLLLHCLNILRIITCLFF